MNVKTQSEKYSDLMEALLELKLIPATGHGSITIVLKDYKLNDINKTTHYLCKDDVVSKENEKINHN